MQLFMFIQSVGSKLYFKPKSDDVHQFNHYEVLLQSWKLYELLTEQYYERMLPQEYTQSAISERRTFSWMFNKL